MRHGGDDHARSHDRNDAEWWSGRGSGRTEDNGKLSAVPCVTQRPSNASLSMWSTFLMYGLVLLTCL